jgi:cyclic pyranopterin phosphate synthase
MPRRTGASSAEDGVLSTPELVDLVRWLSAHTGIRRVKLTGGEPMVRSGLVGLVASLTGIPGVGEVSLTTNGSLLAAQAEALRQAGLARVNVSLDSLVADRFADLSRGGCLAATLAGIGAAVAVGLRPVKLNTVLLRSTWRDDVPRLLDYAAQNGLEPRFIELMRMGTERAWCDGEFVSADDVCRSLGIDLSAIPPDPSTPARTALLPWRGQSLKTGWIAPRSHPFCGNCRRLRLDCRGRLRRCLMDPQTLDLARLWRDMDGATAALDTYLSAKRPPAGGMSGPTAMHRIGG